MATAKVYRRADAAQFANIPQALKALTQWVVWEAIARRDKEKPEKAPLDPKTGGSTRAKTDAPNTWGTFAEAMEAFESNKNLHGIGLVFTPEDTFTFVDLDDAVNGADVEPWAAEIAAKLQSYTELSPSGTGLRIVVEAEAVGPAKRKGKIEIYSAGQYATLTGNVLNGSNVVAKRQGELADVYHQVFAKDGEEKPDSDVHSDFAAWRNVADEEIVKLVRGKRDSHYDKLWASGHQGDKSKDDFDLCCKLAFYTGRDSDRIDRLFRRSRLYRKKWDERRGSSTYGRNTIREAVAETSETWAPDAVIIVKKGEYPEATDRAEEVLLRHAEHLRIFQRAGEVVRIITLPKEVKSSGLSRPEGTIMLSALTVPALMETLERLIVFKTLSGKTEDIGEHNLERINCPTKIPTYYLNRRGSWKLPILTGIVAAPLLRLDGTTLNTEGYDERTGLFLISGGNWLPVPEQPTPTQAKNALEILKAPFAEYPFITPADQTVAIAAILTALERRILGPCPLFGYSAPTPRSGKSKLAGAPAIIATGKPAPASTASPDKEEFRKALTSTLREGHLIVNLDNVEHAIKSPDLCKIITQDEFSDRLLGESTTLHLPTNVLWTATGNNLTFRGDLTTRVLLCDIDANMEQPEHRSFKIPNFEDYLLKHRAEIVAAALTILRAFHVANRPKQAGKPWGGFDQWCAFIREPLIWVGMADPCETRDKVITDDPEKETAVEVFTELWHTFHNDKFTAREAATRANEYEKELGGYRNESLHDVLAAATGDKRDVNQTRLGWWLRSWRDRFIGPLRLRRTNPKGTHGAEWALEGSLEKKK
jgi:hypothetical protein